MNCGVSFKIVAFVFFIIMSACTSSFKSTLRGTGDLGVVVERESGSVLIIENSNNTVLAQIHGLGDLSHASVVFSRDQRFAYVFGRDGGLTKIDLLERNIVKRILQNRNAIDETISQDGLYIAVSNYVPGGIKIFSSDNLELIADVPAIDSKGMHSKTVGLVDASQNTFVYSLFDSGEIWSVQVLDNKKTIVNKITNIGIQPYDGLVTPDGRYYLAGLFGEEAVAKVDLWHFEKGSVKIMKNYSNRKEKLPVFKMPHFEGWSTCGEYVFIPAVGQHELIVAQLPKWNEVARIKTIGQPVFAMTSSTCHQIWINFAMPDNDKIQILDTESFKIVGELNPGPAVLHMEFTSKGHQVWVSVRDRDQIQIYNTDNHQLIKTLSAKKPSGIFFSNRAHRIGI